MDTALIQKEKPKYNKKKFILITGIILALVIAASIFYFFKLKTTNEYILNKYEDTNNWCEVAIEGKSLKAQCKALLMNIDSENSCFTVQLISKTNSLNNLKICEKGSFLTYTNDILNYKKLKPLEITFTYSLTNAIDIKKHYTLTNVSLKSIDENYIETYINNDISNLVTLDLSGTTVKNSVDFCPNPNSLPEYISEDNKNSYLTFFNKYSLSQSSTEKQISENLTANIVDNWNNKTLTILRACDTAEIQQWNNFCTVNSNKDWSKVNEIQSLSTSPKWGTELNDNDITLINQISLFNDGMHLVSNHKNYNAPSLIEQIVAYMNSAQEVNEEEFCNMGILFNSIENNTNAFKSDHDYIYDQVIKNIGNFSSATCANMISDTLDPNGMYIYTYIKNIDNTSVLSIYNRCLNLSNYIKHV